MDKNNTTKAALIGGGVAFAASIIGYLALDAYREKTTKRKKIEYLKQKKNKKFNGSKLTKAKLKRLNRSLENPNDLIISDEDNISNF